mmetsp:Transcript_49932/g.99407  ORF Transcript_49932/g.99407 Transcript_49932/m.99407 type:complete len:667 (-) Transcript_49932:301-2301(-)
MPDYDGHGWNMHSSGEKEHDVHSIDITGDLSIEELLLALANAKSFETRQRATYLQGRVKVIKSAAIQISAEEGLQRDAADALRTQMLEGVRNQVIFLLNQAREAEEAEAAAIKAESEKWAIEGQEFAALQEEVPAPKEVPNQHIKRWQGGGVQMGGVLAGGVPATSDELIAGGALFGEQPGSVVAGGVFDQLPADMVSSAHIEQWLRNGSPPQQPVRQPVKRPVQPVQQPVQAAPLPRKTQYHGERPSNTKTVIGIRAGGIYQPRAQEVTNSLQRRNEFPRGIQLKHTSTTIEDGAPLSARSAASAVANRRLARSEIRRQLGMPAFPQNEQSAVGFSTDWLRSRRMPTNTAIELKARVVDFYPNSTLKTRLSNHLSGLGFWVKSDTPTEGARVKQYRSSCGIVAAAALVLMRQAQDGWMNADVSDAVNIERIRLANAHGVQPQHVLREQGALYTSPIDEAQFRCALACFLGRSPPEERQSAPCARCGGNHPAIQCEFISAPRTDSSVDGDPNWVRVCSSEELHTMLSDRLVAVLAGDDDGRERYVCCNTLDNSAYGGKCHHWFAVVFRACALSDAQAAQAVEMAFSKLSSSKKKMSFHELTSELEGNGVHIPDVAIEHALDSIGVSSNVIDRKSSQRCAIQEPRAGTLRRAFGRCGLEPDKHCIAP